MDTTDPQPQTQPQQNQPTQQQSQPQPQPQPQPQQGPPHHHHHHPQQHRQPQPHAASQQPTQPHPHHFQQQAQLHQQSAHPSQHQHAQSGYPMASFAYAPYQQRQVYTQPPYSTNLQYNATMSFPPYTAAQYPFNYTPAPAATPSSQEISSTPHVSATPLPKRDKVTAVLKDPKTNEEVDLLELAGAKPSPANKAPSTQSSKTDKKTNPTTPAKTNAATNSVTISSSNDRTSTSSPPSISNILLRKVSEDTESDKRQTAATTITTKTTTTTTTSTTTEPTVTPSTIEPATTTKPTPTEIPAAIKPDEKVEPKVNNINGDHKSKAEEKDGKKDEKREDQVAEVVEEQPADVEVPAEEANTESNNSSETKAKEEEVEEKVTLNYEPWQYNPMNNRTGKKKYDKQFLIDVCEKICKLSVFDEEKRDDSMDNYSFPQVDMFAPPFSRNLPHLVNNRQNDASRRSNHQSYMGRSSAGQERARKIIAPSSSLTQEVELKTVANPWRPGKEVKEEVAPDVVEVERVKKSFRSILNKLTPNNFANLASAVTELHIDTETKLGEVIDIVFAKALAEPGYCVLYGQMCSHLKKITAGTAKFGDTLLKRCQNQFQSDIYSGLNLEERKKKIEEETDADVKKHLNEELYEEMYRCRMRGLGLIKFIGELYKIEMLNDAIMFDCMIRLLNDTSEESLECLCDLLVTIGEKLDRSTQKSIKEERKAQRGPPKATPYHPGGKSLASVLASSNAQQQQPSAVPEAITTLDDIFDRLHKIRKNKDLPVSVRIRFKLLDVCELREKEGWQSKKAKDNNPKKIEEIREAHMEKLERENERNRLSQAAGPRRSQEGRRHLGHSSGSSSQISSLANDNRGGSNMHGSASSHALRDHSLDDKMRQNKSDEYETSKQHQTYAKKFLAMKSSADSSDSKSLRPAGLRPATSFLSSRTGNSKANDN